MNPSSFWTERLIFGAISVCAIALIGCAGPALKSRLITTDWPTEHGIAYFLPKVMLQITADLEPTIHTNVSLQSQHWITNSFRRDNITTNNVTKSTTTSIDSSGTNEFAAPSVTRTNDHYRIGLTLLTVPDPARLYSLRLRPKPWSADRFNIVVNSNGFLSSVNVTNDDRTGEIVKKVAETAANIMMLVTKSIDRKPKPRHLEVIVDPTDKAALDQAENMLNDNGVEITLRCDPLVRSNSVNAFVYSGSFSLGEENGVLYRPALPYLVTMEANRGKDDLTQTQTVVYLPNSAPVFSIRVDRAPFVSASSSLAFDNGFLKSVDRNKPSEIEGFVAIPFELSKLAVSIPTNLIQFKIDLTSRNAGLVAQQQKLIDAQTAYINSLSNLITTRQAFEQVNTNK